ncbi:MAG: stage V sporulation protein AA, partial [Clostridium sp.]|nr:stage V sporulation protein AA [Clostridium sp.]
HFEEGKANRIVVCATKLIALMEEVDSSITVEMIGEVDVLLEKVQRTKHKDARMLGKVVLVCFVTFFGTAFTVMAYHNDIGIDSVFQLVHRIVLGKESSGVNILEISYSLGLAIGIFVFFNHVGKRKITKDPTPIEVAMRNYERDVNDALIETAGREGKEEV